MILLQICLFALTGYGTWLILTDFAVFPSARVQKLYHTGGGKKAGNYLDRLADPIAKRLEPRIPEGGYKREKLEHTLRTVGDARGAARYTADAATQSFILAALGLFTGFLNPLLVAVVAALAVFAYFKTMREPEKLLKVKRDKIELELPRLASTISNSLSVSRDVVRILENYRRICGPELADELDVTLADMKTGNAQAALGGLENRIGSTKLSELVRGLLSVLRGEDQALYFYTKNIEFRRESMEYQKQEIQKRPSKLLPYIVGIVVCFIVMLVYILGYQVVAGGNKLF